jgi:hypothetical protein
MRGYQKILPKELSKFAFSLWLAFMAWSPARAGDVLLGYVDGLRPQANGDMNVVGWACAYGVPAPLQVDLYVGGSYGNGGTLIGRFTANQPGEPAVASACGLSSGKFRFSIALKAATQSQFPSQAIFVHALSPALDDNQLLANSGLYTLPLLGNGNQLVNIGSPGGAGWAADSSDYFAKWKCHSAANLSHVSRLKIMPLGNHGAAQWKDSLVADSSFAPNSANNPILFFTLGDKRSSSTFKMLRANYDAALGAWNIVEYLADLGDTNGVSSHAGTVTDFIYNKYSIAGWGPAASSATGKIPGVNAQLELWGSGPLGLTSIRSIQNSPSDPRTCIHMNPSLFDYDADAVPHAFIATMWFLDENTACKLPNGGSLPKSGPYVYRYVNNLVGWQLDMNMGLVEDQGGLDLQMNADPLQPGVIVRADWSGKVMQIKLTPRQTSTVLDCTAGSVNFAEASRGPNGAYYFLADEAPYVGPSPNLADDTVHQHDVFVAF